MSWAFNLVLSDIKIHFGIFQAHTLEGQPLKTQQTKQKPTL